MSKENFQYWKELVGLEDTDFPQLIPLTDENIDRAAIVQTRLMEIKAAVAANNLVDIQIQPGWGATTLFRYLKKELKKDSLTLLVPFDFETNKLDGDQDDEQEDNREEKRELTDDAFIFQTKWKMASDICRMFRDKPMQPLYMYEVLDFEDDGSSPWQGHLRRKMRALGECETDPQKFYSSFPFFAKRPIDACVNYFLANFQIRTVFLYLFPRKVKEDSIFELVGMLKNIYDGKDVQPAAMREIYICTPKVYRQIQGTYARPYYDVSYERYSVAEIFSMLVATYPGVDSGFKSVNDVFDETFIAEVYKERSTLVEIMKKVGDNLETSLEGSTARIPYRLTRKKEDAK